LLSQSEIILRMFVSLLVGVIIGYERSYNQKTAGVRTYSLVCIGATLFMIISVYGLPSLSSNYNFYGFRLKDRVGKPWPRVLLGKLQYAEHRFPLL
jgi:putative Mg2+ transporter-C (MgtC) family protein